MRPDTYDIENRRVKKVAGGLTTHYVWEGSQVIAEYNGSTGALICEYIYAGGRMLARDQGGVMRYYLQDRLSTRMITDGSGAVVGTEDHLPFGDDAFTGTGESEKHRFTTYERDSESGSDYAINRQYSSSTARFLQPDPIAGSINNPQSLNRYVYGANDPVNMIDPLGLNFCPLQFQSCGQLDVYIPGVGVRNIQVGYDGLGYGEFLWNESFSPRELSRIREVLKIRLPDGFYYQPNPLRPRPSFLDTVALNIQSSAAVSARKQIKQEFADCNAQAAANLEAHFKKNDFSIKEFQRLAKRESLKDLATAGGLGAKGARSGGTPLGYGALFVSFVYFNSFLNEDIKKGMDPRTLRFYEEAMENWAKQQRECRENVKNKYGLPFPYLR